MERHDKILDDADAPATNDKSETFSYKAFLSYSHTDDAPAKKLHRRLERFRIPKNLKSGDTSLGTIFRDKEELSTAAGLDTSIKTALLTSENLIVLCSPHAVKSRWVNEEISYFKSLGREDRIFTVLLSGVPFAQKHGFAESDECLPKSIRYDFTETGEIIRERAEPLATDLRPGGDGERLGLLKLVSGLLGLGLDELLQRQLIRARKKMIGVVVGSLALISVFAGLSWGTYSAQKQAEARQADAEDFVEFLLSDLSLQLETYGRLDLLDTVGVKAVNYYAQFDDGDLSARESGRQARTFHFMGELQNALAKTDESQGFFDRAYDLTARGLEEAPQDPDRIFEHARSAYFKSLPLRRKVDPEAERLQLREFLSLCERLQALESGSVRSITQLALAHMNLGRVNLRIGTSEDAQLHFIQAEALFKKLNETQPSIENLLYRTENLAWIAEQYRRQGSYEMSYRFRTQQNELIDEQVLQNPNDFRLIEASVYAKIGLAGAATYSGRDEDAKIHFSLALTGTQEALQLEPRREKMRRAQGVVLLSIMRIAISERDQNGYNQASAAMTKLRTHPFTTSLIDNQYWEVVLPGLIDDLDPSFD